MDAVIQYEDGSHVFITTYKFISGYITYVYKSDMNGNKIGNISLDNCTCRNEQQSVAMHDAMIARWTSYNKIQDHENTKQQLEFYNFMKRDV